MNTKRIAAAFALLSSLSACGGALEPQAAPTEEKVVPDSGLFGCGYVVALADGGDPTVPSGYVLSLGDAALTPQQAAAAGACIAALFGN